jgi:hypothetical protein
LVGTLAGLLFPGGPGDVSAVGEEEDVSAGASAGGSEATRFAGASDRAGRTRADRTGADWTGEGWTGAMDDSVVWLELDVEPSALRKDATC